ncbi:hypothetical protein FRB94_009855 [Tulasnella sp. JGI-2019a]|nr:hypothetical protein FRB94_009855 [Tulasnella sp. JGI-2019a]
MIKIFQYYVEIERLPQRLASVSTTWAAIVMDSPTLWRYIDSNQPCEAYLNSLARSKGAPLVVEYSGSQWRLWREDSHAVTKDLKLFINAVCREVHRWQSASLAMDEDPRFRRAIIDQLAHSPAPLLEKLEVSGTRVLGFGTIRELFNEVAPRLRHIKMTDICIPWESGLFSGLRTLVVTGHSFTRPTVFQLARIMRDCPLLVELRIGCFSTPDEADDTGQIRVQSIELLVMKTLSLELDPIALNFILQAIHIPACTRFHITSRIPTGSIFSGATDHLIPVLSSMLLSADFIDIRLSATQFDYEAHHDKKNAQPLFSVSLDSLRNGQDASPSISLAWILDRIHPSTPPIPVNLSVNAWGLPLNELFTSLRPYLVTTLSVRDDGRRNQDILQCLTLPTLLHGVSCWHLPRLRALSFEECYGRISLNSILSLVESRLGRSVSAEPFGRRELPVMLTKLYVSSDRKDPANAEIIQRLTAVVDDVRHGLFLL